MEASDKAEDRQGESYANREPKMDHDSSSDGEKGWTASIMNRVASVTSPLTEWYYGDNVQDQTKEKVTESSENPAEAKGVLHKIADAVTPEPVEAIREDNDAHHHHGDQDAKNVSDSEGIMDRIASLTSPLTDFIEGYTEGKPKEPLSKESLFHRIFRRKSQDSPTTWKAKLASKITTIAKPISNKLHDFPVTLNGMNLRDLSSKDQMLLAAIGSLVLLLFLFVARRAKKRRQQQGAPTARRRARTTSHDGSAGRSRTRSGSFDAFMRRTSSRDRNAAASEDPLLEQALSTEDTPLVFGGPGVPSISYETWSPPMQWTEASRMLLPVNAEPEQQRKVTLNFQEGILTREEQQGGQKETFAMTDLSINVKRPTTGGVLNIYIKGSPKEGWLEHTFKSAHQAAQFQQDLINYQVLGETVSNMYESLELIQKGSMAHDGNECVLHDDTSDAKKSAVAWDDAMRCFSDIPSLRKALEGKLIHRIMNLDEAGGGDTALVDDYVKTRLLLGHFDFFRLFVPDLDTTALPQPESSPTRVNELLERRKLVARASTMVQAYVRARTVANKGWNLDIALPDESFTKRLAYDEDIDNVDRDSTATNEYYEATVGRDVRCDVHSRKHLERHGSSVKSRYQAFSLVGSQVLKLPPKGERSPLTHKRDPVLVLPSLRKLVETYPDLDFFVCAFFPDGLEVAVVHIFVRSLPRGVDDSFDTTLNRFMNGTAEVRDRKLEVFMQLGPGARLSTLSWAALKTVSLLLSWSRRGEAQIPYESGADRTPFPGMSLSNYMDTEHFGGSLQTNPELPKNYAAVTTHVDPSKMNAAVRVLYQRLEEGGLPACIVDFTFVLEGETTDELPERALGTIRIVHLDALKVALPPKYSASQHPLEEDESVSDDKAASPLSPFAPIMREMSVVWNSIVGSSTTLAEAPAHLSPETPQNGSERPKNTDPFQVGVDALRDILRGVTVPVRRTDLSSSDNSIVAEDGGDSSDKPSGESEEDLVNVPVLSMTGTSDLRRYFRATNCDLKAAAVRIVESAAWRGVTFPIDTNKCRVELQSGQFFQQGFDVDGDPVFYFQNMLMGPWRENVDASIAALLHRLESSLIRFSEENPEVKCTVIALVGKPFKRILKKKKKQKEQAATEEEKDEASVAESAEDASKQDDEQSTAASVAPHTVDPNSWNPFRIGANPRISPTEEFQVHSNALMFDRLAELLQAHYPERLKRLIILPGQGRSVTYMNLTFTMRKLITSSRTRNKVLQLSRSSELPKYVEDNELATLAGGWVEVDESAFEC